MTTPPRRPAPDRARRTAGAGLLALALLPAAAALAQGPSPLQRLRELLGIQRPLAVAGSRSPSLQQGLCVVSPWPAGTTPVANGQPLPTALTPSGAPPIATSTDLAELQIHRNGVLIERLQASSTQPITTPLAWPGEPIPPGGSVDLVLRPMRSSDAVRLRVRRPAAAERPADLGQATALEQLLEALDGDAGQRREASALISRACRP